MVRYPPSAAMDDSNRFADSRSISIVVTNYNGRELLERCLPSIQNAVRSYPGPTEVIVVDDRSTDDSVAFIRENFPEFQVLQPDRNLGFQRASNFAFRKTKYGIVISLNNDIEVTENCLSCFASHFTDSSVFSVSTKLRMWDRTTYLAGRRVGLYEHGHLRLVDEEGGENVLPTLFTTGGACAFDREKLMALDGFDPIFHPLYWEDIDLCYRAWKRGWKNLYDPRILLYHKHQATIETMVSPSRLKHVTARNSYLFLWKNLSDGWAWMEHLAFAPWFLLKDMFRGRWRFVVGFAMAWTRLPDVFAARRRERKHRRLSDRAVLSAHRSN